MKRIAYPPRCANIENSFSNSVDRQRSSAIKNSASQLNASGRNASDFSGDSFFRERDWRSSPLKRTRLEFAARAIHSIPRRVPIGRIETIDGSEMRRRIGGTFVRASSRARTRLAGSRMHAETQVDLRFFCGRISRFALRRSLAQFVSTYSARIFATRALLCTIPFRSSIRRLISFPLVG